MFLSLLFKLIDALVFAIRNNDLSRLVIDEIRNAGIMPRMQVTGIWYDEVTTLRSSLRYHPASTTYTNILEAWLRLGTAFGIDEASQRDLEAAQRARQCSWRMCVYHSTPSEKPLLVCKGCKGVRYCSAACQRR